jgi:hypothetical protein
MREDAVDPLTGPSYDPETVILADEMVRASVTDNHGTDIMSGHPRKPSAAEREWRV